MKKTMLTILASGLVVEALSQSGQPSPSSFLNDPMLTVYITGFAMLLLLVLVLFVTIYVIRVLNILTREASKERSVSSASIKTGIGWWQAFVQKMNASVPVEQEQEIELAHSYDGIRELDNHLPPWWKWLFYGSIGFAFIYLIVYHVTDSFPLSEDEYKHELAVAAEQTRKYQASRPQALIDENTLEYKADPASIEKGKTVFMNNNCGGCHRNDGGGNTIGPNLTDDYWLHGGEVRNVFATIKNGVVDKGMPAWGKSMTAEDVRDVTFFVMSLRGTNPPDAKAPQGEIFKQAATRPDTLKTQAGL